MKNRQVGYLIIGIGILIGFVILIFNKALTTIINTSCSHGPTCPMWGTLKAQTYISIGLMVFIVLIGLFLVFFGRDEKIVTELRTKIKKIKIKEQVKPKEITKENYESVLNKLNPDEKVAVEHLIEAKGTLFQSDLVEKTGFTKVKVTRILDRLEGMAIIERKRRGMTNVVILKH